MESFILCNWCQPFLTSINHHLITNLIAYFTSWRELKEIKNQFPHYLTEWLTQRENASISEIVKATNFFHNKQPYLIVVGSLEHSLSFNLILEFTVIPIGSNCARAFSVLFASFFMLRVEFPKHLCKFYLFFEQFFFLYSYEKVAIQLTLQTKILLTC